MSAKLDLSRARTIQLTMDNERFIQKVWVLRDKRYTDGVGPKINKCLDFLREREELAQLLCSGPDYDIIASEMTGQEWEDVAC